MKTEISQLYMILWRKHAFGFMNIWWKERHIRHNQPQYRKNNKYFKDQSFLPLLPSLLNHSPHGKNNSKKKIKLKK